MGDSMSFFQVWGAFAGLAGAILVSGYYLCLYGDAIAEKSGMGRTWVGTILLATVTSLPELSTGISAVTLADAPDLVAGELFGSCVFNLLILAGLDLLNRNGVLYQKIETGQVVNSSFGVLLIGFAGFCVLFAPRFPLFRLGHIGWYSVLIPMGYFFAMKLLFQYEASKTEEPEPPNPAYEKMTATGLAFRYFFASGVVVGAGILLPVVSTQIVELMGWNEAFVGTLFIALTTSLPEAAVTFSALSIGAIDLAVSNLVGSNLFNMLVFPIVDMFYTKGPILDFVNQTHAFSAFSAVMMSAIVSLAILAPPKKRFLVYWPSWILLVVYVLNTYVVFRTGSH